MQFLGAAVGRSPAGHRVLHLNSSIMEALLDQLEVREGVVVEELQDAGDSLVDKPRELLVFGDPLRNRESTSSLLLSPQRISLTLASGR